MHTGTESQGHRVHPFALLEVHVVDTKPSLCVLPGHSPEVLAAKRGECPAVGSEPPELALHAGWLLRRLAWSQCHAAAQLCLG